MTDDAKELFLADRVRAFATVILTRRDDLTIAATKQSTGLDFHVYIDREDKPMLGQIVERIVGWYDAVEAVLIA